MSTQIASLTGWHENQLIASVNRQPTENKRDKQQWNLIKSVRAFSLSVGIQ